MTWEDKQKIFELRKDKIKDDREIIHNATAALGTHQKRHNPYTKDY